MAPLFTPPIEPSPGTGLRPVIRLLEAGFGDGYAQRMPDGLNHIQQSATLKWDGLSLAECRAIADFFEGRQGYLPFRYTVYGDSKERHWFCREWSHAAESPFNMTAKLEEYFGT